MTTASSGTVVGADLDDAVVLDQQVPRRRPARRVSTSSMRALRRWIGGCGVRGRAMALLRAGAARSVVGAGNMVSETRE